MPNVADEKVTKWSIERGAFVGLDFARRRDSRILYPILLQLATCLRRRGRSWSPGIRKRIYVIIPVSPSIHQRRR